MSRGWRRALPLGFLIALHLACVFGEFLAPNSAFKQHRELAWAPPSKLRFLDTEGKFHLRPFVYPLVAHPLAAGGYREDKSQPCEIQFLVRHEDSALAGLDSNSLHLLGVTPPAKLFLLGTDGAGRDVFARALTGGRTSLFAGLLAGGLALSIGAAFGALAGYIGGKTDALVMRAVELFLALPWLYLLLALRAFLPLDLSPAQGFLILVGLVGCLGWALPARVIRGVILSARERLFVAAARTLGASEARLAVRHVLPQALPPMATQAAILVPSYVLAEVSLSFLGLGLAASQPSWGNLLGELRAYHVVSNYTWMIAAAVPLPATFFCYYMLGRNDYGV